MPFSRRRRRLLHGRGRHCGRSSRRAFGVRSKHASRRGSFVCGMRASKDEGFRRRSAKTGGTTFARHPTKGVEVDRRRHQHPRVRAPTGVVLASGGISMRSRTGRRVGTMVHPVALYPRVLGHRDPPSHLRSADSPPARDGSGGRMARVALVDVACRGAWVLGGARQPSGFRVYDGSEGTRRPYRRVVRLARGAGAVERRPRLQQVATAHRRQPAPRIV